MKPVTKKKAGMNSAWATPSSVAVAGRSAFYLAPIVWGLYGVRIAESARQPVVADAAGVAILLLGSLAVTLVLLRLTRSAK